LAPLEWIDAGKNFLETAEDVTATARKHKVVEGKEVEERIRKRLEALRRMIFGKGKLM
jgi:hypothetical protein